MESWADKMFILNMFIYFIVYLYLLAVNWVLSTSEDTEALNDIWINPEVKRNLISI